LFRRKTFSEVNGAKIVLQEEEISERLD